LRKDILGGENMRHEGQHGDIRFHNGFLLEFQVFGTEWKWRIIHQSWKGTWRRVIAPCGGVRASSSYKAIYR
jgi:hypothetical protein